MPDSFEWPDQETLANEQSFRMWLALTLQRFYQKQSEVARLQIAANGRTSKLEERADTIEKSVGAQELKIGLIEKATIGVIGSALLGVIAAFVAWIVRGGLSR